MLVVSGDHHWRTLAVSFRNLLQHVVFEPYDLILPAQVDHFISYCSPLFQSSQFLTVLPRFNACLLYYAGHAITRLGLLLSHLPQHPTGMTSSPHSSSLGPVFKAQFSLASKIKLSGYSDYLKAPIPLVLNTTQVSISLFSNCLCVCVC